MADFPYDLVPSDDDPDQVLAAAQVMMQVLKLVDLLDVPRVQHILRSMAQQATQHPAHWNDQWDRVLNMVEFFALVEPLWRKIQHIHHHDDKENDL